MTKNGKKIFIITGEYSGDKHAANVVRELLKINPEYQIEAIGGEDLASLGIKLFANHDKMGKVGLTPSIVWDHISLGKRLINYLKNDFKPDLVLMIDYGAFNLAISKHLKRAGFKIFYFIPPQIWASRKWRIKTIKKNIDKVFTIFPFEAEFYEKEGINSVFAGHPLVKELPEPANKEEFFARHNLDLNKKLISIFPGSRTFEIKYLLDIFIKAAKIIESKRDDIQFVFSHAPNLKDDIFKNKLNNYRVIKGENRELLSVSDGLILASGTVALEACLYKTPMVISYRGPFLFYLIYLMVRSIKNACLVNIISKKDIVPEFLMYDATPDKISEGILNLIENDEARKSQISGFEEVEKLLSNKHCVEVVAQNINKELE